MLRTLRILPAAVCLLFGLAAQSAESLAIRRVTPRTIRPGRSALLQISGSSNELQRFSQAPAARAKVGGGQEFTVAWTYRGEAPVDRVDVRFEFRQQADAETRSMELSYRAVGPGAASSVFLIADKAIAEAGPVEGWKVSLLTGDTVVDSRQSWSWKR